MKISVYEKILSQLKLEEAIKLQLSEYKTDNGCSEGSLQRLPV